MEENQKEAITEEKTADITEQNSISDNNTESAGKESTEENYENSEKKVDDVSASNETPAITEAAEADTRLEEPVNVSEHTEEPANAPEDTDEPANAPEDTEEPANASEDTDEPANASEHTEEPVVTDEAEHNDASGVTGQPEIAGVGNQEAYVDKSLAEEAARKSIKRKKAKKICLITGISLLSTAVLAYLAVALWFMFHYNRNTYIDDMDMSFHTTADMRHSMNTFMENYKLTVHLRDNDTHIIRPSDINMRFTPVFDEMDAKHMQNGLLWPLYISKEKRYTTVYEVTYDEALLEQYLSGLDCMQEENMNPAKDAYVVIKDGKAVVVEETHGTVVDYEALKAEICKALNQYQSEIDLNDSSCYLEAAITADSAEIAEIKAEADHYLDMIITYRIDDVTWDLDASTFGSWMHYYNGRWIFSKKKAEIYVEGLAERYNTVGTTRNFRTYHGSTVQETGYRYGWAIDQEAETEGLIAVLQTGESAERTPEFLQTGAAYNSYNDIGDTYIEVDLTNQHVYVTIDGDMVYDTSCVTGCISNGHGTPSGLYEIAYKESPSTLRGEDYESFVNYWMPFNRGIGLHDATWRGSFGGSIYYYDGSHGCVNLPFYAAQTIYSYAYPGMPVICYY